MYDTDFTTNPTSENRSAGPGPEFRYGPNSGSIPNPGPNSNFGSIPNPGPNPPPGQIPNPGPNPMPYQSHPGKKPKKSGTGFGKKVMAVIGLGLFFGIFGGLGFQAVTSATDFIKSGLAQAETRQQASDAGRAGEDAVEAIGGAEGSLPGNLPGSLPGETSDEAEAGTQDSDDVKAAGLLESGWQGQAVVTDVSEVARNVMPAVVAVNNNFMQTYEYFGREFSDEAQSSGSGIIVGENDTELLIATNDHVIYDQTNSGELEVQFADGTTAMAQVKGKKSDMDLAVIAVLLSDISEETRNSIAIATLGDSDSLVVGEPAIAIGNAMGYGQSVTTGIISALNRESSYYTNSAEVSSTFIQTDAAINPGNSGGALLNIRGEVIGINSNKMSSSGSSGMPTIEGMGYAIPISVAKPIIADLMTQRTSVAEEERGYMGIRGMQTENEFVEEFNLPRGVYIVQVDEGTPAEAAGLIKGDIITRLDGAEIQNWDELETRLSGYFAGETITVTIMRGNAMDGYQEQAVEVTLGVRPPE